MGKEKKPWTQDIQELEMERFGETIASVLRDASQGTPTGLRYLLQGSPRLYYEGHPVVKIKQEIPREIIESCFVEAYRELAKYAEKYSPIKEQLAPIAPLYRELEQKGVVPLTQAQKLDALRREYPKA